MSTANAAIRHDWSQAEVMALFGLPFNELLFRAHQVHRLYFNPREVHRITSYNVCYTKLLRLFLERKMWIMEIRNMFIQLS